jgi:phosphonate transport system permease protein
VSKPAGKIRGLGETDRSELKRRYPQAFQAPVAERCLSLAIVVCGAALAIYTLWRFGFSPAKFVDGLDKLGIVVVLMMPPDPGNQLWHFASALAETLAIAFLGTLGAAVLALPMSMLAAKNVVANRILHFASRRFLDTIRGVDTLIWALIWINVVGLGPFAGILAIMTSDFGSFGKLFSEAIEASDRKPVDGVLSAGGSELHSFRFGILPQVLPVLMSQVLYYFESNTRSATIIGIVGAGGIGLYLANEIAQAEWQRVAFIILMILVTVSVIDWISSRLRLAMIGRRAGATA